MLESKVLAEYGRGDAPKQFPDVKRGDTYSTTYRVRGGELMVAFKKGRVEGIETTSKRYRAGDGFGVGSIISEQLCPEVWNCAKPWHGFNLDAHEEWWTKFVAWNGHGFNVYLGVHNEFTRKGVIYNNYRIVTVIAIGHGVSA
jgi:hypothetical protein